MLQAGGGGGAGRSADGGGEEGVNNVHRHHMRAHHPLHRMSIRWTWIGFARPRIVAVMVIADVRQSLGNVDGPVSHESCGDVMAKIQLQNGCQTKRDHFAFQLGTWNATWDYQ